MYVSRLIYCSRVADGFDEAEIERILEVSHRRNFADDITGLLCFCRPYFLQCLEGSRRVINELYPRLLRDPRHQDVMLLGFENVVSRSFYQWSMGYIGDEQLAEAGPLVLKHSGSRELDPYRLTDVAAFELLHDLSQSLKLE